MIQLTSIVFRGRFNPAIVQPHWLAAQGLIGPSEADGATIDIIHPQVTQFRTEWLHINVSPDRFQFATTQEAYFELLRDLAVNVFTVLRYTPLEAFGVNREFHFRLRSDTALHEIRNTLAPRRCWEDLLSNPGMKSLVVQGARTDGRTGYVGVTVEASVKVIPGVYVAVNDHYQLSPALESPASAEHVIEIIPERWTSSMSEGLTIAEKIASLGDVA